MFTHADNAEDVIAIQAVMNDINEAITEGQSEQLIKYFATGSIKIDLFKAHDSSQEMAETDVETHKLKDRWRAVLPMLHNISSVYERKVTNINIQLDGDMAVAWMTIETKMVIKVSDEIKKNDFTEIALLKKINNQWKVASLTNNRSD